MMILLIELKTMESFITRKCFEVYDGYKYIDPRKLQEILKSKYEFKISRNRLIDIFIQIGLIDDEKEAGFFKRKDQDIEYSRVEHAEDIKELRKIIRNIIESCINSTGSYDTNIIKRYIMIANGIELTEHEIILYSENFRNKNLIKILISERKDITYKVVKKISGILNLDEDKTIKLLTENGYKFKISDSDLEKTSLSKERVYEMIDLEIKTITSSSVIDYEKLSEICKDRKELNLEKIISKYSLKEKEIVEKLESFTATSHSKKIEELSSSLKIDLVILKMIISNIRN